MKKQERNALTYDDMIFFQNFYAENKRFMYYTARKLTSSPADQDDLVQDATLRLLNNISTLRELSRCKNATYIVLTIRSVYLDQMKQANRVTSMDDATLEQIMLNQLDSDAALDRLMANIAAERLRVELSARDWLILEAYYILGLTNTEICQLIGVSPDSVRMTLHRARKKAKNILDKAFGGDFYG